MYDIITRWPDGNKSQNATANEIIKTYYKTTREHAEERFSSKKKKKM